MLDPVRSLLGLCDSLCNVVRSLGLGGLAVILLMPDKEKKQAALGFMI